MQHHFAQPFLRLGFVAYRVLASPEFQHGRAVLGRALWPVRHKVECREDAFALILRRLP